MWTYVENKKSVLITDEYGVAIARVQGAEGSHAVDVTNAQLIVKAVSGFKLAQRELTEMRAKIDALEKNTLELAEENRALRVEVAGVKTDRMNALVGAQAMARMLEESIRVLGAQEKEFLLLGAGSHAAVVGAIRRPLEMFLAGWRKENVKA